MSELIITPRTKVLELIVAYPQLEDVLIEVLPAFKKLRSPILRKTVARITTLQQAAVVGNVEVEDLINQLRKEVGQDLFSGESAAAYTTEEPDWFSEDRVVSEFNAKEMLAAGEQPVNQVMADLNQLDEGGIYKIVAPFVPAPLLDKASSLGLAHWINQTDDEEYAIYFSR
jgi:hypothetical protein